MKLQEHADIRGVCADIRTRHVAFGRKIGGLLRRHLPASVRVIRVAAGKIDGHGAGAGQRKPAVRGGQSGDVPAAAT